MPMYNLIEYSDNYSDTSGSLWQFKRDEIFNNAEVTNDNNAPSFKYKAKNQQNKQKAFRWPFRILKSLELMFLNISNLSIPLNFIYPKIRITNLDEHLLCKYGLFADKDV